MPDAIPTRLTGTDPVSEWAAGVPARPRRRARRRARKRGARKQRQNAGIYAAYLRVSTVAQDIGPDVQRAQITSAKPSLAIEWFEEHESARTVHGRPILTDLLDRLDAGEFDGLVVSKLDRLSRSVQDFLALVDRAVASGWALVVCDGTVGTTTATGRMVASIFAVFAEFEAARSLRSPARSSTPNTCSPPASSLTHRAR